MRPRHRASTDIPFRRKVLRQVQNRRVSLRELFLPMLGNWTGIEQQAALPPSGPATSARAMIVFKLDLSDQVVVQDYRQVRADQCEFSGHGVFMIDRGRRDSAAPRTPILWWFFDSEGILRSRLMAAGTPTN